MPNFKPTDWAIITNAAAERTATDPGGNSVTIHDTVLRARRHAPDGSIRR